MKWQYKNVAIKRVMGVHDLFLGGLIDEAKRY